MMNVKLIKTLDKIAKSEKAEVAMRFFKTGKGQYGEGDKFIGVMVPDQRKVARKFVDMGLDEVGELLEMEIHEYRLTGLFVLELKYKKAVKMGDEKLVGKIVKLYLDKRSGINNWDLVDLSAPNILGDYLYRELTKRGVLYEFAKSKDLWERRIAILACFAFIKRNEFDDAMKIAEILLYDSHDLIQKAVGWMLREIGKRDYQCEEDFLLKYYKEMPRTMLRYAIEKFPDEKRKFFMKKD